MEQLKLLMDYTKFHIGMYASLITALLGFLHYFSGEVPCLYWFMVTTLLCFFVAGAFGGIIASSIPRYKDYESFSKADLAPLWLERTMGGKFETLAAIEHGFFWIGITTAMFGAIWCSWPKK